MSVKNVCLTSKVSRKIILVRNIESIDNVLNFENEKCDILCSSNYYPYIK